MATSTKNLNELLPRLPLFQALTEQETEQLSNRARRMAIPKQHRIYDAGELSDTLFILNRGTVKIGRHSKEGREVIKQIVHPVSLFGEMGLVGERTRQNFATAMNKEVVLYALSIREVQALLQNNSQLAVEMLQYFGNRLRRTENRLESLIFKDARERIIDFLKDAARKRGERVGYETLIRHSLTQQDIANITGTSRQTVTSVLNDLRKSNLIYFNRRSILIRDLTKLS